MMTAPIKFKPPWVGATPTERQQLETELAQEVCLLHPLAALDREVVARRIDTDDILIAINPHLCECVQVRLTWSGKTEMNPEGPSMELQATFQDWVQERMLPDHKTYINPALDVGLGIDNGENICLAISHILAPVLEILDQNTKFHAAPCPKEGGPAEQETLIIRDSVREPG